MSADISTIGAVLRKARLTAGWSQVELSDRLGLTPGTISRAESGRDLRLNTLIEIARALDLDLALIPRRLRANVAMLVDGEGRSSRHTAVYTGGGDEPYFEGDPPEALPANLQSRSRRTLGRNEPRRSEETT